MKLRNKIIAAGLCTGMALSMLTGCASSKPDNDAVVATVGDSDLTLGVANLMFRYTQATTGSYLKALLGIDANIWEQDLVGNGTPYGASLKDSILSQYERMVLLEQHMEEYDVELTDEEKAAIEAAADQFIADNDEKALTQMSGTKENVVRLLTLYTIEEKMETAIKESADVEVTDEEAAQKRIRYVYFAIPESEETEEETEAVTETETEAETETEEASEADSEAEETETEETFEETPERTQTREDVQAIIDEVKGGQTLDDAVAAYDSEKNIIENTYGETTTSLSQVIIDAAEGLEDGEICSTPAEAEGGFYIVEMVSTFDEEATAEEKEDLLSQRKSEFYSDTVEGWEPDEITVNEKVWDKVDYLDDFHAPETEAAVETESEAAQEESTEAENGSETEEAAETETETASETESEA